MRKKTLNFEDIFLWSVLGIGVFCMFAVVIYAVIKQETHQADCLTQHAIERSVATETIKPATKNNVLSMESCQCVIKEEHTVCTCPNTNASTKTAAVEEKQNNGPETTGEKVVFWGSMGALALAPLLFD
nr:MAG TPA: hypothetical protein [Caudoviricetes sp.]DAR91980.1 MAG TPA: hypothetical protein [Bacteriophage sp.]